jgi:predicted dehydrogenase
LAGKDVFCEKPLATNYADARSALDAVEKSGVRHAIGFNYRRLPAVALMAEMIQRGELGEIQLWRGTWLSDEFVDPDIVFDWRFESSVGGSTVGDLGSHLIDMATWMLGPIDDVTAMSSTFVHHREDAGQPRVVEVDDASSALVRFSSGAQGTLEVARAAPRRPCDFTLEVNGSTGTVMFAYAQLNELWVGNTDDDPRLYGLRRVRAEHPSQPETGGWWPIGQGIGYDASLINQVAHLASTWEERGWSPDFAVGANVAAVCAAMERSVVDRRWVSIDEIANGPS